MASSEQLIHAFRDTEDWIYQDRSLEKAVSRSIRNTVVYPQDDYPELDRARAVAHTEVSVTHRGTFQAARELSQEYPGRRIAVHNFASAITPGSRVAQGGRAQEESLCRCSTLYPVLNSKAPWEGYYNHHREMGDARYSDAVIYSPDILIIKSDADIPQRLEQSEWCKVDVVTCSAPNLQHIPSYIPDYSLTSASRLGATEQRALHEQRARHMLTVAAANRVDILVLGAFGCLSSQNDPEVVAAAYADVLPEFSGVFLAIEFAIIPGWLDARCYQVFRDVFG